MLRKLNITKTKLFKAMMIEYFPFPSKKKKKTMVESGWIIFEPSGAKYIRVGWGTCHSGTNSAVQNS